ncbi:MAG: glycerophosphodiester phosphodiesterase family protein [Chitinophagaceae bacterium]
MKKRYVKALTLFAIIALYSIVVSGQLPVSKNGFIVISHRGSHMTVPENTLDAVKAAIKDGADYVEIDLRTTKDGKLVIMHDATVDRMTNGTGKVKDLAFDEVRKLNVQNKEKPSSKTYRIPEFSEVLKACKSKINIYLDFKDADVSQTWQQIKDAGMEKQVAVYVNSVPSYKQWRSVVPGIPVIASAIDAVKTKEQLSFFLSQVSIQVLDNVYEKDMIATANENNVSVWLDAESDHEDSAIWKEAMEKGIQGLQTDHPKELVEYLKKSKLRDGLPKDASKDDPYAKYNKKTYREFKDIKYSDAPDGQNTLDAFIPKDLKSGAKVIIYIHGGGWSGGDKGEFPKQLIEELAGKRGYVVTSINYRLVKNGENHFPAQIEDVKKAITFITKNAKKYDYNGNEYALMGGSAGGHLAMLYAYGYDELKQIKTVVDLWGPTDLTDKSIRPDGSDADNTVINFLGEKDPSAQITKNASPSYFLTKETGVPTILFHGKEDPLSKCKPG